jgi:hypothetical protein
VEPGEDKDGDEALALIAALGDGFSEEARGLELARDDANDQAAGDSSSGLLVSGA